MIIGVSGYARAGKDSTADVLVGELGFVKRSFANPMRDALLGLNPIVGARIVVDDSISSEQGAVPIRLAEVVSAFGWDFAKEGFPEVRNLLQRLGTEVGRTLWGEDFWVNLALADAPNLLVIPDVRFPNEAEAIRATGRGQIWRVERPGIGPVNGHISDNIYIAPDVLIRNEGTLDDLRREVLSCVPCTPV